MGRFRLRRGNINWTTLNFVVGYHVALLVALPFYFIYAPPSLALVLVSVALLFVTTIGITAGYHRLYSHRAYKANRVFEGAMLTLGTLAIQGNALEWAADHRRHHAKVDTDEDPYSIRKGFWYAHVLWMFEKPGSLDESTVTDLMRNPLLRFQHRHFGWLAFGGNLLLALLVGWAVGDFLGAFVLAFWTRLAVSHHFTWFINSAAHTWGERTYSREHSAVDNFLLALVTVGEGYHNYHHTFASDYRNGVRWYHFDPGKWTIWLGSKLGMTYGLKRYSPWVIQRRLLQADRHMLLERVRTQFHDRRQAMEARITAVSESIQHKLQRLHELNEAMKKARAERRAAGRRHLRALREEFNALKRSLRHDRRTWYELCGAVLEPATA